MCKFADISEEPTASIKQQAFVAQADYSSVFTTDTVRSSETSLSTRLYRRYSILRIFYEGTETLIVFVKY